MEQIFRALNCYSGFYVNFTRFPCKRYDRSSWRGRSQAQSAIERGPQAGEF